MTLQEAAQNYAAALVRWNELNIQSNRSGLREDLLAERQARNKMYDAQNLLDSVALAEASASHTD